MPNIQMDKSTTIDGRLISLCLRLINIFHSTFKPFSRENIVLARHLTPDSSPTPNTPPGPERMILCFHSDDTAHSEKPTLEGQIYDATVYPATQVFFVFLVSVTP